jgi:hypothetical protein
MWPPAEPDARHRDSRGCPSRNFRLVVAIADDRGCEAPRWPVFVLASEASGVRPVLPMSVSLLGGSRHVRIARSQALVAPEDLAAEVNATK